MIGIPTLAAADPQLGRAAAGIGFVIPGDTVTSIASQLIATGKVSNSGRASLGITAQTVADAAGRPAGAGVVSVTPGGPAAKAGIQPGDIITILAGHIVGKPRRTLELPQHSRARPASHRLFRTAGGFALSCKV